jgi:hypothetical protein
MNKTPIFKTTKMKDASVVSDSIFLLSLLISLMQLGKAMQFSFPNRICWLLKSDIESANYWTSMLLCCLTMGVRVVVFNFTFNSIFSYIMAVVLCLCYISYLYQVVQTGGHRDCYCLSIRIQHHQKSHFNKWNKMSSYLNMRILIFYFIQLGWEYSLFQSKFEYDWYWVDISDSKSTLSLIKIIKKENKIINGKTS